MLFVDFRNKLQALQRQLTDDNFKDTRRQLIDLQREMHEADLAPAERAELKHQIQQLFDQINILQEKDQEDFEREADENHAHLKERLFSCIDFVQENLDDHDAVWQKLLDLQDDFRGRRMRADERETLYAALQELFTIVKNRRQKAQQEFLARSEDTLSQWQDKVASLAKSAETANLDAVWQKLVDTSQQIRDSQMIPAHKKALFDVLDEGFAIARIRKEEEQEANHQESAENARVIQQKLQQAAEQIDNNPGFHENWQLLLAIQQEFRDRRLEKSHREDLYAGLQVLFETVKSRRNQEQEDFETAADEALQHLHPLVEEATKLAKTSREFKKTKGFLIRVQKEFKGRRIRKEERESLYSRLQSAFDTLNRRINEHIAARKDIRVFKVDSKLSDLQTQVDELEAEINKDLEKIQLLEHKLEDLQVLDGTMAPADQEQHRHQLRLMQAAMNKKTSRLRDLQEEMQKLMAQKDWLDGIE